MSSLIFAGAAFAVTAPENTPFEVQITGKGRPVIFIPGLSSSGETWDTTVARFKSRFECHVLTVAGLAGVPRVPGPILDRVRDGLAEYIRKNKLEKPAIVGHSLGGYLALDFAAKCPDLPGRIVIVDAYPFYAGLANPDATAEQARRERRNGPEDDGLAAAGSVRSLCQIGRRDARDGRKGKRLRAPRRVGAEVRPLRGRRGDGGAVLGRLARRAGEDPGPGTGAGRVGELRGIFGPGQNGGQLEAAVCEAGGRRDPDQRQGAPFHHVG